MLIDSHCHIWTLGQNGHAWPTADLTRIYRDFSVQDLVQSPGAEDLSGVVLVQAQPCQAETEWLLALAAADPLVLGVVGWTDITASDAPDQIRRLAANPRLKGLRPMLQDLPEDWILDPKVEPALAAMVAADLSFDALIRPRHLPSILTFARRWPDLRLVIDHGAKPDIAAGRMQPWAEQIAALAQRPGVHCKLSGLLTEAGETASAEAVAPYAAHLLEIFAPDRLMWGSDWPVLNLAGDYPSWRSLCEAWAPAERQAALFGQTAQGFYRL